jgi:hypothetical protein
MNAQAVLGALSRLLLKAGVGERQSFVDLYNTLRGGCEYQYFDSLVLALVALSCLRIQNVWLNHSHDLRRPLH